MQVQGGGEEVTVLSSAYIGVWLDLPLHIKTGLQMTGNSSNTVIHASLIHLGQ